MSYPWPTRNGAVGVAGACVSGCFLAGVRPPICTRRRRDAGVSIGISNLHISNIKFEIGSFRQPVLLDLSVQRPLADAEDLGCLLAVTGGHFQGVADRFALKLFEADAANVVEPARVAARGTDFARQARGAQFFLVR